MKTMKMQSGKAISDSYNAFVLEQQALAVWFLFWLGIALAYVLIVAGWRRLRR